MYRRIIKSGQARFVEAIPEYTQETPEAERDAYSAAPAGSGPDEHTGGPTREEIQAAYDELLTAAQEEASLLLEDSRREAYAVVGRAREDAARLLEEARREGWEQGLSEGREQGRDEASGEMRELLERGQEEVDRVIREAYENRDRMLEEMEPKVYRLALEIAEKILSYELDHNEEAFISILSQAMGSIQAETKVTLRVGASEFMRYFHSRDTARIRTEHGPVTAGVMIDASVEPGGCLLETDTGMIDASAKAQLEQIAFNLGLRE